MLQENILDKISLTYTVSLFQLKEKNPGVIIETHSIMITLLVWVLKVLE